MFCRPISLLLAIISRARSSRLDPNATSHSPPSVSSSLQMNWFWIAKRIPCATYKDRRERVAIYSTRHRPFAIRDSFYTGYRSTHAHQQDVVPELDQACHVTPKLWVSSQRDLDTLGGRSPFSPRLDLRRRGVRCDVLRPTCSKTIRRQRDEERFVHET